MAHNWEVDEDKCLYDAAFQSYDRIVHHCAKCGWFRIWLPGWKGCKRGSYIYMPPNWQDNPLEYFKEEPSCMFFDKKVPVETMLMIIACSSDLIAIAEVQGDNLVIKTSNPSHFGQNGFEKGFVPIQNGCVSQDAVEKVLRQIGAVCEE